MVVAATTVVSSTTDSTVGIDGALAGVDLVGVHTVSAILEEETPAPRAMVKKLAVA